METTIQKHQTTDGTVIKQEVPRYFIEILYGGEESKRNKWKGNLAEIQKQIDKSKKIASRIRVLWHSRKPEVSREEQIEWLKTNAVCKYSVLLPEHFEFPKGYANDLLTRIRRFEETVSWMKSNGIERKKFIPTVEEPKTESESLSEQQNITDAVVVEPIKEQKPKAVKSTKAKSSKETTVKAKANKKN
jgi:hypothetical protein